MCGLLAGGCAGVRAASTSRQTPHDRRFRSTSSVGQTAGPSCLGHRALPQPQHCPGMRGEHWAGSMGTACTGTTGALVVAWKSCATDFLPSKILARTHKNAAHLVLTMVGGRVSVWLSAKWHVLPSSLPSRHKPPARPRKPESCKNQMYLSTHCCSLALEWESSPQTGQTQNF